MDLQQNKQKLSFIKQIFPFKAKNNVWLVQFLKSYLVAQIIILLFAILLLLTTDRKTWEDSIYSETPNFGMTWWFSFSMFHSSYMYEVWPHGFGDRLITCLLLFLGYYFILFMITLVVLSQLTGEQRPTLLSIPKRIIKTAFPSFCITILIIFLLSILIYRFEYEENLMYIHKFSIHTYSDALYYCFGTFHRIQFLFIEKNSSKIVSMIISLMGILYYPYIIALVCIRRPTYQQHQSLLEQLNKQPVDEYIFGDGYTIPEQEDNGNQQFKVQPLNNDIEMQNQQQQPQF